MILFSPSATRAPLMRVSAASGTAIPVPQQGLPLDGYTSPQFLPDGRFLFHMRGGSDVRGIYLGALDGRAPIRLVVSAVGGAYLPAHALAAGATTTSAGGPPSAEASRDGGWLLWLRPDTVTLVAQRLDLSTATLVGEPVTVVAEGVAVDDRFSSPAVSVATAGFLAYRGGAGGCGS